MTHSMSDSIGCCASQNQVEGFMGSSAETRPCDGHHDEGVLWNETDEPFKTCQSATNIGQTAFF